MLIDHMPHAYESAQSEGPCAQPSDNNFGEKNCHRIYLFPRKSISRLESLHTSYKDLGIVVGFKANRTLHDSFEFFYVEALRHYEIYKTISFESKWKESMDGSTNMEIC